MTVRYAVAFGSAVLAALGLVSTAHAVTKPQPNNVTYSSLSVAANGNAVTIPLSAFSYLLAGVDNNTTPPAIGTVFIAPPPGTTFTLPAAGGAYFFDCGPNVTTANASPGGTAAPFSVVAIDPATGNIANTGTFGTAGNTCKNGDYVILNSTNNVGVTLNAASQLANPGDSITIYAEYQTVVPFGGDSAPFVLANLSSASPVVLTQRANNQLVDASGTGSTTPGTVFIGTGATPATPSPAGFLGWVSTRAEQLISASTGGPISTATASPNAFPVNETVTITGNFTSVASAYLVTGASTAAACTSPAPAGTIATTSATSTQLVFTVPAPANFAARTFFAVCVLNTPGAQIPATTTTIDAVANNPASSPNLLAANTTFGSIAVNGSTFFAQNVFGFAQTGTRTYFRVVNQGNTPAQIWAIITNDVPNTVPETGAGNCAGADTPTCNISFVANLTSTFVTSNTAAGGSTGLLQPNTATYYTADDIAALAGTTATSPTNGFLESTVRLLSPNGAVVFSALSQGGPGSW